MNEPRVDRLSSAGALGYPQTEKAVVDDGAVTGRSRSSVSIITVELAY